MRRFIGIILLLLLFAMLIALTAMGAGIKEALLMWGFVIFIWGIIELAVWLIVG